jgi:hypothetical protein
MGSGTAPVPLNDYGSNLGRAEEKDSYKERKNTSRKCTVKFYLDEADFVIDGMTERAKARKPKAPAKAKTKTKAKSKSKTKNKTKNGG